MVRALTTWAKEVSAMTKVANAIEEQLTKSRDASNVGVGKLMGQREVLTSTRSLKTIMPHPQGINIIECLLSVRGLSLSLVS